MDKKKIGPGRLKMALGRWGADILLILGACAVSVGIGLVFPPAGLIGAGVFALAGGVLASLGKGADR